MNGHRLPLFLLVWSTLGLMSLLPREARTADDPGAPLHERIDRVIDAGRVGPPAALTGDAEFLRRVSLDLTGMPPGPEELRAFLAETVADKRARAIDRLLASPAHARHLATTLDVMLMERRTGQNSPAADWQTYLFDAVRENRPLNEVLKEILLADGADGKLRPAARFYLDRGSEPNLITRDVGRILLGRDMQCAQCHNHPLIEDYQQSDYHGLLAFYAPAYALTRKEGGKNRTFFAEKVGVDLTYDSVFVKDDQHRTGPRILGGTELAEPVFPPGDEYQVKPADDVLPVPRFSRRARLAALVTGGTNRAFNENVANRLWSVMMGRGLVHPLDLHHPANPPSDPELLALLADAIVELKFDARAFLRTLALTKTYQRVIDLPVDQAADSEGIASALAELKTHTPELQAASEVAQSAYSQAVTAWHKAESAYVPVAAELDQALAKHAEADKKQADAQKAVDAIRAQIAARQDVAKTLAEAAEKALDAAKKLAAEKDLAVAAQKFVDRSTALRAELTAQEKTRAERTAVLQKAAEAVAAAAGLVNAARAKAQPLRERVREQEKAVLAARGKMAETRTALEHHKVRRDLLETYLKRCALDTQFGAAAQALAAWNEALAQVRKAAGVSAAAVFSRGEAEAERTRNDAALAAAEQAASGAESRLKALQSERAALTEELATLFSNNFALAQLKPLTPEQMCWSMLKVTGVYDRTRLAEETALNKSKPLTGDAANDPDQIRARAFEIEQRTFDKLKGSLPAFVTAYAAAAGQPQGDFFATPDQALFAANDGLINGWVVPTGGNITERMVAENDPGKAAEDLYATILTRTPSAEESADVVRILTAQATNKTAAVQELVWGLLTSAEFRFNH
jgi:hypothetical protein